MGKFDDLLKPQTKQYRNEAGFLRRAGALLLDILVIDLFLTGPFQGVFTRIINDPWNAVLTRQELGATLVLFLLAYGYFVLFEYLLGQTPGMMLLSLRLKQLPKAWQALTRNVFVFPIFPFFVLWVVEPLMLLFTGRSVLERVTKTRLLYERTMVI